MRAVAAIIASSRRESGLPAMSRDHSRKQAVSIGKNAKDISRVLGQLSISEAFAASGLRASSTPSCNSPIVTAERKICSGRILPISLERLGAALQRGRQHRQLLPCPLGIATIQSFIHARNHDSGVPRVFSGGVDGMPEPGAVR